VRDIKIKPLEVVIDKRCGWK